MLRRFLKILTLSTTGLILSPVGLGCGKADTGESSTKVENTTIKVKDCHPLPDTLRVGTLYSPTSYFIYRDTPMGYDYELITRFAEDKKIAIDLTTASNLNSLIAMLDSGKLDLIACEVPVTSEYKTKVSACGPESITHQVLVQPKPKNSQELITDVTQLIGKEVYVEAESKYHQRLKNLNDEVGGGIIIKPITKDTLITEDLIAMVSDGIIPLTVVDSDIARINRTYFSDLDINMEISFPQRAAWGVRSCQAWLGDSINSWLHQENPMQIQSDLLKQYFEKSKEHPSIHIDFSTGHMSKYDNIFRQYSKSIKWDWRLISAMGFIESRYDSSLVSWAGARGIMQLMPATAKAYGLDMSRITYNRDNIATAIKIIASLDSQFSKFVPDSDERKKFVIAAYNSGPAHIIDAISLARKFGYDSTRWLGNVEHAMMLKSKPEYYNDQVCRYGYFNGRQTFDYVHRVLDTYERAKKQVTK